MIARLQDTSVINRAAEAMGADCLTVSDNSGKLTFLQITDTNPAAIAAEVADMRTKFQGEIMVTIAKGKEQARYVVTCAPTGVGIGAPSVAPASGVSLADYIGLLNQLGEAKLEIAKAQMAAPAQPDYLDQALGAFASIVKGQQAAQAMASPATGDETGEGDALDAWADADPQALELAARLVKLKATNPATYEQAKAALLAMTA